MGVDDGRTDEEPWLYIVDIALVAVITHGQLADVQTTGDTEAELGKGGGGEQQGEEEEKGLHGQMRNEE